MATIEEIDTDISNIRTRILNLRAERANRASILLSQPHLAARSQQQSTANGTRRRNVEQLVKKQQERNLENTYRACAGITAFKVKDPDPHAVDNGNVLGVRIDVSVGGKFIDTYEVLLNRPNSVHRNMLKIHKHTIPPCIPLQGLATKWLPVTSKNDDLMMKQNLVWFGRALRKELVSWHIRKATMAKLRGEAGLSNQTSQNALDGAHPSNVKVLNAFVSDDEDEDEGLEVRDRRGGPPKIIEIEADTSVRDISIVWSNGQTANMKVTKDGQIEKAVVWSGDKRLVRLADLERRAIGRIEGLVQRLT